MKAQAVIGSNQVTQAGHHKAFTLKNKKTNSNTSLSQISFYLLVCRELNSHMTDTSQGRDQTTFEKKIAASISEHIIIKK
jgi:hypothetical protein